MTVRINDGFVEDRIRAFQDRYGEVEVVEDVVEIPAAEFESCLENAREGYVGGAYAWVTRDPDEAGYPSESYDGGVVDAEQALLIMPRGQTEWGLPGGGVESDESFERAARREVLEEAGVGCEITGLWRLERKTWRSDDADDDRESVSLHVFFDAGYVGGSITVQAGEVDGAVWFAEPPEPLMDETAERAATFF